ncbi:MAG: endonuclease [Planctomycetes bacterium]|nr:endonuclease [Planctomycetota bacterium]
MPTMHPLIAFALGLAVGLVLLIVLLVRSGLRRRDQIDEARAQSVRQSASTIRGQIAEQLAPLLPGFEYSPADSKFLGDPIDYVIFDGLNQARHADGDPDQIEVVLVDVKHGRSDLNKYQRAIARAVEDGRVRFRVVRIAEDNSVTTRDYKSRRARAQG